MMIRRPISKRRRYFYLRFSVSYFKRPSFIFEFEYYQQNLQLSFTSCLKRSCLRRLWSLTLHSWGQRTYRRHSRLLHVYLAIHETVGIIFDVKYFLQNMFLTDPTLQADLTCPHPLKPSIQTILVKACLILGVWSIMRLLLMVGNSSPDKIRVN